MIIDAGSFIDALAGAGAWERLGLRAARRHLLETQAGGHPSG